MAVRTTRRVNCGGPFRVPFRGYRLAPEETNIRYFYFLEKKTIFFPSTERCITPSSPPFPRSYARWGHVIHIYPSGWLQSGYSGLPRSIPAATDRANSQEPDEVHPNWSESVREHRFPLLKTPGNVGLDRGNSPSVLLRDIIIDGFCSRCRSLRRCCSRYRPIKRRILPVRYVVVPIFWLFITDTGIHIGDYCNGEVFLILEGNLLATRIKQIVKISSIPVTIVNVLVWQQQVR